MCKYPLLIRLTDADLPRRYVNDSVTKNAHSYPVPANSLLNVPDEFIVQLFISDF